MDTAADVNLIPATVYTQIYEDSNLEHLGPMDINLSVYNDSAIQAFGTCTKPLVSPVNSHIHETKFYVANHSGSVLFSCEDSLYLELIQSHPVLSTLSPHNAHIISSEHDTAYINFVTRDKNTSHYCATHSRTPSPTSPWTPQYHLCEYLIDQCPFTNKKNLSISLVKWNKLV